MNIMPIILPQLHIPPRPKEVKTLTVELKTKEEAEFIAKE